MNCRRPTTWPVLFVLLFLTGCGFHLRGIEQLPVWLTQVAVLIEKADPEWGPLLRDQLQAAHVTIVDDPMKAPYWLIIQNESTEENIMSISSGSSPRQYQLTYRVQFTLQRAQGSDIRPLTTILVTRPLTINNDRILGSHDEEDQLEHEMRRDAALQILYRLAPLPSAKTSLKHSKRGLAQ